MQNEVTHQIFMSFLPPVVGCLLKTWLTKGGGGSREPQDPPGYAPVTIATGSYRFSGIFAITRHEVGQGFRLYRIQSDSNSSMRCFDARIGPFGGIKFGQTQAAKCQS